MKAVKTILAGMVLAMSSAAEADSGTDLYWYLDLGESAEWSGSTPPSFDRFSINLWSSDGSDKINLNGKTSFFDGNDHVQSAGNTGGVNGDGTAGLYVTDLSGYAGSSAYAGYEFLITLYNGGWNAENMVAWSPQLYNWAGDRLTLGTMLADNADSFTTASDLNPAATASYYNFGATLVPEPASELLLLVGGALLALRRRRI